MAKSMTFIKLKSILNFIFISALYSAPLQFTFVNSALGESLPAKIIEYKNEGECEKVKAYIDENDLRLFHYRSCVAKNRDKYIDKYIGHLDCDKVANISNTYGVHDPIFECRAKLASKTSDFRIHTKSFAEQKDRYFRNMISAKEYIKIADSIHHAAEKTSNKELIQYSKSNLMKSTASARKSVDRKNSERFKRIVEEAHDKSVRNKLVDLRRIWGHRTKKFFDSNPSYPNSTTDLISLSLNDKGEGRDLCNISIETKTIVKRNRDGLKVYTSTVAWDVNLINHMRDVMRQKRKFSFELSLPDELRFRSDYGVKIKTCQSYTNPLFDPFGSFSHTA